VSVTKKVKADSQSGAEKTNAATLAGITVNGAEVLLNANAAGAGNEAVESDLTVYLPRKAALNIGTQHGDVNVTGRTGEVQVSDSHGDVSVTDVAGSVRESVRHGSARASQVTGDVAFEGRIDHLEAADVHGNIAVNGEVMDGLDFARVDKQISFKSSRTDLELAALPGDLTLQSGDIRGSGVSGPLRLATRSYDIHLEDLNGDARITNSNGSLEVQTHVLGALHLTNRNADIRLLLPAKAAFQLEATTQRGDISSDFEGLSVSSEHGEGRAAGVVGTGGPRIEISNEHGDVAIKKM
jgi:DUF4097 and DUF4098 domain-containing protein YvlB